MRSSIFLFCLLAFLDIASAEWTTLAKRNSCPASSAEVGNISAPSAVAGSSGFDDDDYGYYGDDVGNYGRNDDDYNGDDYNYADPTTTPSSTASTGIATTDIPTDPAKISSILGEFASTGTPTSSASSTATGLEELGNELQQVDAETTEDEVKKLEEKVEEEEEDNTSDERSTSLSKRGDLFSALSATLRKVSDLAATWAPSSGVASKASDWANALEEADTLKTGLLAEVKQLLILMQETSQTVAGAVSGTESPLEAIVALIHGAGAGVERLGNIQDYIKQVRSKLSTPTTLTTVVGSTETARAGSSSDKSSSSDPASDALASGLDNNAIQNAVKLWGRKEQIEWE